LLNDLTRMGGNRSAMSSSETGATTKEFDADYQRRRREVEARVKEARAKQVEEEEAALKRIARIKPMSEHKTGLPPDTVPNEEFLCIPVFEHGERTRGRNGVIGRAMTMVALRSKYGAPMSTAVGHAFYLHVHKEGALEGFSMAEALRHGLGIYLIKLPLEQFSEEMLEKYVASFDTGGPNHGLFSMLLDPDHIEKELPNVHMQCAFRPSEDSQSCTGKRFMNVAMVFILHETMDIWHPSNKLSPGHRYFLKNIRKKLPAGRTCKKLDVGPSEAEIKEDIEFQSMSFEDVLRQEKLAGKLIATSSNR